ncbi:hypothetical protein E4U43_003951 [Claviceps pusilla]|uniref:Uncharacterized protein n=1 Tax=Claviceps pusilla TaxID=123648 RepID=A0A9P7N6R3_9HYPO|nr:hypothetical protein E4U43_003951 [Claviceps pusilla]
MPCSQSLKTGVTSPSPTLANLEQKPADPQQFLRCALCTQVLSRHCLADHLDTHYVETNSVEADLVGARPFIMESIEKDPVVVNSNEPTIKTESDDSNADTMESIEKDPVVVNSNEPTIKTESDDSNADTMETDSDGESVYVIVNPFKYIVRCDRCLKGFREEYIADHRKTHYLAKGMTHSVSVPTAHSCTHCLENGHECLVAKRPNHSALQTLKCLQCLISRQTCSFERTFRPVDLTTLRVHPAILNRLLTPSPSPSPSPSPTWNW